MTHGLGGGICTETLLTGHRRDDLAGFLLERDLTPSDCAGDCSSCARSAPRRP